MTQTYVFARNAPSAVNLAPDAGRKHCDEKRNAGEEQPRRCLLPYAHRE